MWRRLDGLAIGVSTMAWRLAGWPGGVGIGLASPGIWAAAVFVQGGCIFRRGAVLLLLFLLCVRDRPSIYTRLWGYHVGTEQSMEKGILLYGLLSICQ